MTITTGEFLRRVRDQRNSFRAAQALFQEQLSPNFSLFDFINPNEVRLSKIIAWILSPRSSHAQGARFLNAFVQHFDIRWPTDGSDAATVQTEAETELIEASKRRIDVLVKSGGWAVGIENKPWAADQGQQVSDYLAFLDRSFPGKHCLIYLSASGSPPGPESISAEELEKRIAARDLLVIGYESLLPWIKECRSISRSARVSEFLGEFSRYIQRQFMGITDMSEREHILTEITRSPEMVASAMQIIIAADQVREKLIISLEEQLRTLVQERGWSLLPDPRDKIRWSGFRVKFSPADEFLFKVEFQDERRSSCIFGIVGLKRENPLYSKIRDALLKEVGNGGKSDVWPWFRTPGPADELLRIDANWWASENPWTGIAGTTTASEIMRAAQLFYDALNRHGLLSVAPVEASPAASAVAQA